MLCSLANNVGAADVQSVYVVKKGIGVKLSNFQNRLVPLLCSLNHLVFTLVIVTRKVANISDIHDVSNVIV